MTNPFQIDLSSWQAILFMVGTFLSSALNAALGWRDTLYSGLKEKLSALRKIHPLAEKTFSDRKILKARRYKADCDNLCNFSDTVTSGIETLFLVFGLSPFVTWAVFSAFPGIYPCIGLFLSFLAMSLVSNLYCVPFSYLDSFSLEARHGFNKMTRKTFFSDLAIEISVGTIVTFAIVCGYSLFLQRFCGPTLNGFLCLFGLLLATGPVLEFVHVHLVMPLFNKFEPLAEGTLRDKLESLMERCGMKASSIVVMDSGKRSSHSNAFVHGMGRKKRIVLFDEILKTHTEDEIVSIVAHEIGHAKLHHLAWNWAIIAVSEAATAAIAVFLMNDVSTYHAFGYRFVTPENIHSFRYVGYVLSIGLIGAVSWMLTPLFSWISREMEYWADAFSARLCGKDTLRTALIKLCSDNLSNVAPDPASEAWNYSHPSILPRLQAIGRILDPDEKWSMTAPKGKVKRKKRRRKTSSQTSRCGARGTVKK